MLKEQNNGVVAVVLGGHVNALSIIKELHGQGITQIALLDHGKSLSYFSNKVIYRDQIRKSSDSLLAALTKLITFYQKVVIYPTNDLHLEHLQEIYHDIKGFCYVPLNPENLAQCSDKFYQYQICESVGVPYPKTVSVKNVNDIGQIASLDFPILIKPSTRKDLSIDIFRALYLDNAEELGKQQALLLQKIEEGVQFIASEYIPGDDTNIYAYTCFRSQGGDILNEWTGKKLTQFPNNYGVFSSASNDSPEVILDQGRAIVEALDAYGIIEPEFKYDHRDGKYKLMETNLRSMMWNGVGAISGVNLHQTQYQYATSESVSQYEQNKVERIHLVLMLHEIPNLIARKGYWKHFKHNVWAAEKRVWAIFEWRDLKPFCYSLYLLSKRTVGAWLRRFDLR